MQEYLQKRNGRIFMKNKIVTISELRAVSCKDNSEPIVNLKDISSRIYLDYRRVDSGVDSILVRKSVADKLQKIQKQLELYDPQMQLMIVEGYRPLAYQEKYYLKELLSQFQANPSLDFDLLLEHTHQFVALPTLSGHPTGGAIDLTIAYSGQELDMGGRIADFTFPQILPTYSNFITQEQAQRRILLHNLMVAEDFAPFYGEWWHFSYGDREWAAFYNQPEAIYSPIFM